MAQGEKVPIVFLPKFTALAGGQRFKGSPVDLLGYDALVVTCYRGHFSGSMATPTISFELFQSADNLEQLALAGPYDPGADTAGLMIPDPIPLRQRFARMEVEMTGFGTAYDLNCTVWAMGYAIRTRR